MGGVPREGSQFSVLNLLEPEYRPVVVAASLEPVETDTPLKLVADRTFAEVPAPFAILVPGGGTGTLRAMADDAVQTYVRTTAETAQYVTSVCTGALVLAAAGLLEGRKATTHWAFDHLLERLGAHYLPERWVEDGRFVMSAGVAAGMDMALHLVSRLTSEEVSREVQLQIEYDPEPPFGPIDWEHVDRDKMQPLVDRMVEAALEDHPDLLARLRP